MKRLIFVLFAVFSLVLKTKANDLIDKNQPSPVIYLANVRSGENVSRSQLLRVPIVRISDDNLKDVQYKISAFSISFGNKRFQCKGNVLSAEAKNFIPNVPPGTKVFISNVDYSSSLGVKRVLSGSFIVR